jgi:hypothetical protein
MTKFPDMGGFDLNALAKQAEKLQNEMARVQAELGGKTVEAASGGGMVTVVANGMREVVSVRIDKEAINPNDPHLLEDLVTAAVNLALRKAADLAQQEMSKAAGGLLIPGMGGMGPVGP